MTLDLSSMNRKELEKLSANVNKALAKLARGEKKRALEAAEKAARSLGYTLAELTGEAAPNAKASATKAKRGAAKVKKPGVAKYRNPDNRDQTWTGKGRKPNWIVAGLEAGRDLSEFAI